MVSQFSGVRFCGFYMGVSKNRGVPQNGWFIMETPIKMDDLGGTPIFGNTHMCLLFSGAWHLCLHQVEALL